MRNPRTVIPLPDYERVFRVIYSVIEEHANAPHACIFFATVGAAILELKYKIPARPVAGAAAIAVHADSLSSTLFGRIDGDHLVSDTSAFHTWVQAGDIAIDFMAPLFRESLKTYGHGLPIARRMFQKPLREMSPSFRELRGEGAFFLAPNPALSVEVFKNFMERPMASDLANVCLTWFTKPPKPLSRSMGMRDDEGNVYYLSPKGPEITGVW